MTTTRAHLTAHLLLAGSVLFWAGNWVLARALRYDAPPIALAFWRWTSALAFLLPVAAPHLRADWRELTRSWKTLFLLGVLATSLQHIPVYVGLRYTTATNGALLYSTTPVFILLAARAVLHEPIGGASLAGIVLSLAGAAVLVTRADWSVIATFGFNVGDFCTLIAATSWAVYTIILRWRPLNLKPVTALAAMAAAGVVSMLPLYAWEIASGRVLKVSTASVLGIGYLGLFATVLAYLAWNRGVEIIGAVRAGPYLYLLPVFAAALATLLLGEQLHGYHFAGVALIFGGIYLTSKRTPRLRA